MGNPHPSAGVYVTERDFSQRPQRSTTSIGVVVGEMRRGPVGQSVLVTSESEYVEMFGKPDATLSWAGYAATHFLTEADRLYATRVAPEALYGGCEIYWDGNFNRSTPFASGIASAEDISFVGSSLFTIYAINPGDWNDELFVRLTPDTKIPGGYFYVEVFVRNTAIAVEKFRCHLDFIVDGFGVQLNVEQQINRKSDYIQIVQNHEQANFVASRRFQFINTFDAGGSSTQPGIALSGGEDGRRATEGELMMAWDIYRDPEVIDINILINAGYTMPAYQMYMNEICQERMDCVAILDVPSDMQRVQDAIAYRRNDLHLDSSYAALYTPDVLIADKYNDIRLYTPVSGLVAAAYARTDRDYETWFAPAGMIRGDLKVAGVREVYDQGKRDALYESQVNAIRVIEGAGIKIWGADTLQVMPSALSNMSVRRLMIVIEKTLGNLMLYSVFDPNDQILRTRLQSACSRFLQTIRDARGLYGFDVICDESNNGNESIAAGDLNIDIWVDPVLPAKRVQFTAIINKTGVRVTGGSNL